MHAHTYPRARSSTTCRHIHLRTCAIARHHGGEDAPDTTMGRASSPPSCTRRCTGPRPHAAYTTRTHAQTQSVPRTPKGTRAHTRTNAHARTHTHTRARTHTRTQSRTHTSARAQAIRTHARTHTRTQTIALPHTHTSTQAHKHRQTDIFIPARTRTRTHAHAHTSAPPDAKRTSRRLHAVSTPRRR